jgi:enterochelin esterase family protein
MTNITPTDIWYRTYKVRNDARFVYKLSENDPLTSFVDANRKANTVIDPLNPRVFPTQHSAPSQEVALRPSDTPGKVEQSRFHSATLNNDRDIWVYTPHDFNRDGASYPLVVVLDGRPYTTWVPVPTILDNLIQQRRIAPVVAIMVGAVNRETEQSCSTSFGNFLADELVPWMRANYHASAEPQLTVIGGSSRGGLASTCAAYHHPTVFGKVLSQSGSYWWKPDNSPNPEWLTAQFARVPKLPLRFYIEVGLMEISDQLDTNRRFQRVLNSKGYAVDYREFNGNHTYLDWRGTFGDGLVSLIGSDAVRAQ